MRPIVAKIGPPAAILALSLVRLAVGDPFAAGGPAPPPREEPAVSVSAQAVLDGLAIGDAVGPLQVAHIWGPRDGAIVVELVGGGGGMRVWITRRGARTETPPERTERFDLFYGPPTPNARVPAAPDDVCISVLHAIAARIDEGGAEPPSDL